MMAESEIQSHSGDSEALQLLADVLNALLDPSKQVLDDTCLEKLLSWLAELASKPVTLRDLLHERTDVIGFLRKSASPGCDASALTFSLRLAAILLNSFRLPVKLQHLKDTQTAHGAVEVVEVKGRSGDERTNVIQKVDVIIDLTEQLLIGAQKLPYWREASIRNAYFVAAKALICTRCPSEVVQRLDVLKIACETLEDSCMFVVSADQRFIAAFIASSYSCYNGGTSPQSIQQSKEIARAEEDITEANNLLNITHHQQSTAADTSANFALTYDCSVKSVSMDNSNSSPSKKIKLVHSGEDSADGKTRRDCDCRNRLKAFLQKLMEMLQAVKPIYPLNAVGNIRREQCKLWIVSLGVVKSLIESWPAVGHRILNDMSIVSVISELLEPSCHIHPDMCPAVVEFVSVFVCTFPWDRDDDVESTVLRVIIGLPGKLMNIHQFSSSIRLASIIYCGQQRPNLKGSMWLQRLILDTSLLRLITLPLECLLYNQSQLENGNVTSGYEFLLREMVSRKCRCVTLLCHSLCALEKMLAEGQGQLISQQTSLMEDMTSILSMTLGQPSHQTVCNSLAGHVRGSLKVTKGILSLLIATVDSENEGYFKMTEASVMRLLEELTAVLNNPESDCTVISKCLEILASLLSMYALILKEKTDLMKTLGDIVTKKSWDSRWEVRDSIVCFFQRLLQSSADSLHAWFKFHHFNLRVLECVNDGESFVRASALAAIVYVSKRQELWQDLLQQTGKTEMALVRDFINIILEDSQGFARRAATCSYIAWLNVFPWLKAGLPCIASCQGQREKDSERPSPAICGCNVNVPEELSAASQIRTGISTAMFDLDWEVKLGALTFWETLIDMYVPVRNGSKCADTHQREQGDCEKGIASEQSNLGDDDVIHEPSTSMLNLMQLLKEEEMITRLGKVLGDEDRTVALKACQMLRNLQSILPIHSLQAPSERTTNTSSYPIAEDTDVEEFISRCRKELEEMSLERVLEAKMKVVDGYEEHPLSLLQDILAVTQGQDSNVLDCY